MVLSDCQAVLNLSATSSDLDMEYLPLLAADQGNVFGLVQKAEIEKGDCDDENEDDEEELLKGTWRMTRESQIVGH